MIEEAAGYSYFTRKPSMDAKRALSIQRSGPRQIRNIGVSTLSASFTALPSALEETYPKSLESQSISLNRQFMQRPPAVVSPLSSSSGFSTDLHFSSVQQQEKHPRHSPFISQTTSSGKSVILQHPVDSKVLQSSASSHFSTNTLPEFHDFPLSTTTQSNQLFGSNGDDHSKPNDWQDWADQLITDNDALSTDWNGLLADVGVADPEPKVEVIYLLLEFSRMLLSVSINNEYG